MSFDDIPEDREESHPCKCGGNITKRRYASGYNKEYIVWECDKCDFEKAVKNEERKIT